MRFRYFVIIRRGGALGVGASGEIVNVGRTRSNEATLFLLAGDSLAIDDAGA
jgi:hypothetical protein